MTPEVRCRLDLNTDENVQAAGGYRRGLAARLAGEHGRSARTWEHAVSDARSTYKREKRPAAPGAE